MSLTPEWISPIASSCLQSPQSLQPSAWSSRTRSCARRKKSHNSSSRTVWQRSTASFQPASTKALLGSELSEEEYQSAFDELFRYIDLTNEQVSLRQRKRITRKVWEYWVSGIQANLALPAFKRAWSEIQNKSNSFQELRRLEQERFKNDPRSWKSA
jgi:hypothetical protein